MLIPCNWINYQGAHPWRKWILPLCSHWLSVALHLAVGSCEVFPHRLHCGHHEGLVYVALLLRCRWCNFSVIPRSHCLVAGTLALTIFLSSLLQRFLSFRVQRNFLSWVDWGRNIHLNVARLMSWALEWMKRREPAGHWQARMRSLSALLTVDVTSCFKSLPPWLPCGDDL